MFYCQEAIRMWCRALLAAVAVTYILCVLILNGLQKEDLDVSTLRKLQRHNVNIEDVNNETLRKDCEVNRNPSTINDVQNETVTLNSDPDRGDKQEDQMTKFHNISNTNMHDIFKTYFSNAKLNNNDTVKAEDVEIFINVWNMMRKTKEFVEESTTKVTESSSVLVDSLISKKRSDERMDNINKILQSYIDDQKITTTDLPTTNINYDLIAQKIKDLLAKDSKDADNLLQTESTVDNNPRRYLVEGKIIQNGSEQSMHDITKQYKTRNKKVHFVETNDEKQTEKRFLLDNARSIMRATKPDQRHKSDVHKEMNLLSEDIIRELSENVRAKVLQDLKKIIITTSTTTKATPTTKNTTVRETTFTPTEITEEVNVKHENKENAVTDVLEKFIEMFQKFKTNKEIPTAANAISEDKNIKTENKTPSTLNVNVIKSIPVNITSLIINPYNPIHTQQNAVIPNQPYNLFNIQNLAPANLDHKITQLNIFNTKNIHRPPITIQTNSVEVPPLGLPAQQSFVYQNIVVTTKHPFKTIKLNNPYKSNANKYKNNDKNRNMKYTSSSRDHYYTEFGIGKNKRSREVNERYSNEKYKHKYKEEVPIKYKDYGRSYSNDHNIERFHEKLERAEDWPSTFRDRHISRESRNMEDYSKPRLISRHQLPLNEDKKRSSYDDAHFKNFLKTQQKVNDMLERILATKTNVNGPRSVETTVT